MGNVDAANGQNGIEVRDTASLLHVRYNTFCGLAAFEIYTDLGNHGDGMLISSTGGNILLRTNVITENGNDGVEIQGSATGVRVAGNIIGIWLDSGTTVPMGNQNNGVEINGNANNNFVGGPQPTFNVIPQNTISSNAHDGVAILGSAHNNIVSNGFIGTNVLGTTAYGNGQSGVYLGPGSYSNTVGSTDPTLPTVISGNLGDGINMNGTHGNSVIGTYIGTDAGGTIPVANGGNGILITNSFNNVIGNSTTPAASIRSFIFSSTFPTNSGNLGDIIAFNTANGVFVASGTGNRISDNSIHGNGALGIDLATGANLNQAAPVLTTVTSLALSIRVAGHLTSTPNTTFTLEFFANYTSEPSGNKFLGGLKVTTNASGYATFTYVGARPPTGAHFITATATDPSNNTSEFSNIAS